MGCRDIIICKGKQTKGEGSERHTGRRTDRQMDRQTDGQTDIPTQTN